MAASCVRDKRIISALPSRAKQHAGVMVNGSEAQNLKQKLLRRFKIDRRGKLLSVVQYANPKFVRQHKAQP